MLLQIPRDMSLLVDPQPLILLASTALSQLRTLEAAFVAVGYAVTTAASERETLEQARDKPLLAIVLDVGIAPPGFGLCHTLRTDPALSPATAIVLTRPGKPTRTERLEAWRAGAWDLREEPLDPEEFLAHLRTLLQARLELDRLGAERLVDRATGLYNPEGLARRSAELGALATRHGFALGCAVFRPTVPIEHDAGDRLALAFKAASRTSDAVGRTGQTEFAVFAPSTNTWAAARLVRRLSDSVARAFSPAVSLRAGYSATQASHKISPPALLAAARSALESAGR